ncbi:NUDIX domain-containing protein [Paenibacillus illinoisensis]
MSQYFEKAVGNTSRGKKIDETPEACAIRELFEETGQVAPDGQ